MNYSFVYYQHISCEVLKIVQINCLYVTFKNDYACQCLHIPPLFWCPAVFLTTNVWKTSNVLYVQILLMFYSANLQIKYLQVLWPPLMMCHQLVLTGYRPAVREQSETFL